MKRKDPLNHKAKSILVEDTRYLDIDADVCSPLRNPKRLNERFRPRQRKDWKA